MKKSRFFLFFSFLVLLLGGCIFSDQATFQDYYVTLQGNDATGDGSQAKPWRHIAFALNHINYSNHNARLNIADGQYDEKLTITHPVFLRGTGTDKVRLFNDTDNDVIVTVQGPGLSVRMEGMEIDGQMAKNPGIKVIQAGFKGVDLKILRPHFCGIQLEKSPLFLLKNITVTTGGKIFADYGIDIQDSFGVIDHLTAGDHIDHIVNIAGQNTAVELSNSILTGSPIYWADGVRIQSAANVSIHDTQISRPMDGEPADAGPAHNPPYAGIEIAGGADWGKTITVQNCQVSGFDVGIGINLRGNTVKVRNTSIASAAHNAVEVLWQGSGASPVVDFGSVPNGPGNNTFFSSSPYAFYLHGPFDIEAKNNNWDGPPNTIEARIHDKLDDPGLGRVLH